MVRYRRLTLMEREEMSRLLAVGHSLSINESARDQASRPP